MGRYSLVAVLCLVSLGFCYGKDASKEEMLEKLTNAINRLRVEDHSKKVTASNTMSSWAQEWAEKCAKEGVMRTKSGYKTFVHRQQTPYESYADLMFAWRASGLRTAMKTFWLRSIGLGIAHDENNGYYAVALMK